MGVALRTSVRWGNWVSALFLLCAQNRLPQPHRQSGAQAHGQSGEQAQEGWTRWAHTILWFCDSVTAPDAYAWGDGDKVMKRYVMRCRALAGLSPSCRAAAVSHGLPNTGLWHCQMKAADEWAAISRLPAKYTFPSLVPSVVPCRN